MGVRTALTLSAEAAQVLAANAAERKRGEFVSGVGRALGVVCWIAHTGLDLAH
jgi:hypothetical protein